MPRVVIVNETNVPLHIALKHISPIHYVNNVAPQGGRAVFERVGRVWFTIEARVARQAANSDEAKQTTEKDEEAPMAIEGAPSSSGTATPPDASSSSRLAATKAMARGLRASMQGKVAELRGSIDPDQTSNEYTTFQSVAPPIAVSVAALSLGAGALYIGATAAATGSISAALSSTSAEISAAAMSTSLSARRMMKFAAKGQKVVQIGQVLGIGGAGIGGSLLGWHDAEKIEKERQEGQQIAVASASGKGKNDVGAPEPKKDLYDHLTDFENINRVKHVTRVLKRLVTKPVVSSHGWYMGEDRTVVIRGGPQAAEVERWLIIETDTVQPFEVVGRPVEGDKDDKSKDGAEQEQMQAIADGEAGSPASSASGSVTSTQDEQGQRVEKHDPIAKLRKEETKEMTKESK